MEQAKQTAVSVIDFWQQVGHKPADEIYRAMIAAAPRTPAEGEEAAYDRSKTVPVAWIAFADNGNIRLWTADERRAKDEKSRGLDIRAFTLAELIALVSRLGHAEALVENAWQQMSSAPRDGTHFWAYQDGKHYECWWHDDWPRGGYWMDHGDTEPEPEVWRYLPLLPAPKHSSTMLKPEVKP